MRRRTRTQGISRNQQAILIFRFLYASLFRFLSQFKFLFVLYFVFVFSSTCTQAILFGAGFVRRSLLQHITT